MAKFNFGAPILEAQIAKKENQARTQLLQKQESEKRLKGFAEGSKQIVEVIRQTIANIPRDATPEQIENVRQELKQLSGNIITSSIALEELKKKGLPGGLPLGATDILIKRLENEISAQTPGALQKQKLLDVGAESKARKGGELEAARENIDSILENGESTVENVLSGGESVSNDARRVAGLFSNATKLAASGQTGMSNNLLSQARFIVDNSPDIQKAKDLNKPISRELAAELQVPVGTTMGEVMDAVPRKPEEVAAAKSKAVTQVKSKAKALEQLAFLDQGTGMISALLQEIKLDPTVVGATGSLRKAGQTVKGILSDLGADKLVSLAEALATSQSDLSTGQINNLLRSKTLSTLDVLENSIGFILARARQPTGRLFASTINLAISDVKLKGLISSEQVVDRLTFLQELIGRQSTTLRDRFGIEQLPQVTETPTAIPRFRIENGALVEIQ